MNNFSNTSLWCEHDRNRWGPVLKEKEVEFLMQLKTVNMQRARHFAQYQCQ
jgi:hypothetical protein